MSVAAPALLRSGGASLMPSDLPSRPPRKAGKRAQVPATERVKSKTDKVDPRFEAARKRVAREEERRARAEAARREREAAGEPAAEADDDTDSPSTGFSFNQTTQRPGDGEQEEGRS